MTVCVNDNKYSLKFERSFDRWLSNRQTRSFRRHRFSISRISSSFCDVKKVFRLDDERFWLAKNSTFQTVRFMNKEKDKNFFSNLNMFFRNCYTLFVIDLLNELTHLFFFVWRKKWKRFLFSKVDDDWW